MGYCKIGGGHFQNPRKIFANHHTISKDQCGLLSVIKLIYPETVVLK